MGTVNAVKPVMVHAFLEILRGDIDTRERRHRAPLGFVGHDFAARAHGAGKRRDEVGVGKVVEAKTGER